MTRHQKGFSLIELLIVVAIILIIAAIAIPNLLRARIAANEASAASGMRTIATAQVTYKSTFQAGYADSLSKLGPPSGGCSGGGTSASACLIDWVVAGADTIPKSGYTYNVGVGTSGDSGSFVTSAFATNWNKTGVRTFCTTDDNVVRVHFPGAQDHLASASECLNPGIFMPVN
jgi:type IV pilus assembly protein PilA